MYGLRLLKVLLLLVIFAHVYSGAHASQQVGLPTGLCAGKVYQCDKTTLRRWAEFQAGTGVDYISQDYLSVGSCSENGKSDREVYVLLAILQDVEDVFFDAKISWFNNLENFIDTPATKIQDIFPDIHSDRNQMQVSNSHAYVDYSEILPFRYWVRHNQAENKMIMVVYFGLLKTFLCEFETVD